MKNLADIEEFLTKIEKSTSEPTISERITLGIISDSVDLLAFRMTNHELSEDSAITIDRNSEIYPGDIFSVYRFFNTNIFDECENKLTALYERVEKAINHINNQPQTFNNYSDFERYLSRIEKVVEPTEKAKAILISMREVLRLLKVEIKRHELEQSGIKLDEGVELMFGDISDVFEFFGNDSVDECKRKLKALRKRQKLALKQVKAYLKANK
jgi:hypothetical protein